MFIQDGEWLIAYDLYRTVMMNLPSTQLVEKKAMLRVSRGLSWVQSGDLVWGSDSPVRDELSTWTGESQQQEEDKECVTA